MRQVRQFKESGMKLKEKKLIWKTKIKWPTDYEGK
jgi:hypothetical protein